MYRDLAVLLNAMPPFARKPHYNAAILEDNVLGKTTAATRLETYERLSQLYALDMSVPLFRGLRTMWGVDPESRPMLALLCAIARDPILRVTAPVIFDASDGEAVPTEAFRAQVEAAMPDRFNAGSLRRVAGNIASSWTQSGHLRGRQQKTRASPPITPGAAAYAILLGYLKGARGKALLRTFWSRLVSPHPELLLQAANAAARRGLLEFKRSGDVYDIHFSDLLTPAEEEASREPD